jgi:hypothetical protein
LDGATKGFSLVITLLGSPANEVSISRLDNLTWEQCIELKQQYTSSNSEAFCMDKYLAKQTVIFNN